MRTLNLHGKLFNLDRPQVMTIVNATPDSFFAASRAQSCEALKQRVAETARYTDIYDVGGCSTRPGALLPSADEEYSRLSQALEVIRHEAPEVPISVDTFRASVARRCIDEWGVEIINDVGGGRLDPQMWDVVAERHTPYVLMHMEGTGDDLHRRDGYADVTCEVIASLAASLRQLRQKGVADVIVDPGLGFSKTVEENYRMLNELEAFGCLNAPLLVGLSRKSMIYKPLGITPEESLPATTALHMAALMKGATILRVHDPKEARQTIDVFRLLTQNRPATE